MKVLMEPAKQMMLGNLIHFIKMFYLETLVNEKPSVETIKTEWP